MRTLLPFYFAWICLGFILSADHGVAEQVVYDNTHLLHNGEMFFPGPQDEYFAQAFDLGDHNTVSSVTVMMALGEFTPGTVRGTIPFTLWNDINGHPGEPIADLGAVDPQSLPNSIFPGFNVSHIVFNSPINGLTRNATYYVVGDQSQLEGNTLPPRPQTVFIPFLSRSAGSTGAPLQVNGGVADPIEWTDQFGFGDRYLQMSVTASNTFDDQPLIDYSQDRLIFSEPKNVLSVSSRRFENFPHVSDDGLRIYFSSDAPGSNGELPEIYMAERTSVDDPFGEKVKLGGNQGHVNFLGSVSADERSIYYASFAPPTGSQTVYQATRDNLEQSFDFANATPISELNNLGTDVQLGHVTDDSLRIYFNAFDGDVSQAYVASRESAGEAFVNAKPVLDAAYIVEQESKDGLALLSWSRVTSNNGHAELFIATRESSDEDFERWSSLGPVINSPADETFPFLHEATTTLYFSSDRPGTHNPQEGPPCCAPIRDIWQSRVSFAGDYDFDQRFTVDDIDMLSAAIRSDEYHYNLDNDLNGFIDQADLALWVTSSNFANTYLGDANLDGEFNSSDLVEVFQSGKYELAAVANWAEGDWNADQRFDSGDLILAFQGGGYEAGARVAMATVPEPSSLMLLGIGVTCLRRRRCTANGHRHRPSKCN